VAGGLAEAQAQSHNDGYQKRYVSMHVSSLHDDGAPHEIVAGATRPRALEYKLTFLLNHESDSDLSSSLRRNGYVNRGSRDSKAVIGVFAGEDELHQFAALQVHREARQPRKHENHKNTPRTWHEGVGLSQMQGSISNRSLLEPASLRDALRISIGTPAEMKALFAALNPLVNAPPKKHRARA
jgi:hypothetical protein